VIDKITGRFLIEIDQRVAALASSTAAAFFVHHPGGKHEIAGI
jgi:hypothetical protein